MKDLTEADLDAAKNALIEWFKTQDLDPANAGFVMSKVIASQLVAKTHDINDLSEATNIFRILLVTDVAVLLRA